MLDQARRHVVVGVTRVRNNRFVKVLGDSSYTSGKDALHLRGLHMANISNQRQAMSEVLRSVPLRAPQVPRPLSPVVCWSLPLVARSAFVWRSYSSRLIGTPREPDFAVAESPVASRMWNQTYNTAEGQGIARALADLEFRP